MVFVQISLSLLWVGNVCSLEQTCENERLDSDDGEEEFEEEIDDDVEDWGTGSFFQFDPAVQEPRPRKIGDRTARLARRRAKERG